MKEYVAKLSAFLDENGPALHRLDPRNPVHRDLIEAMYGGAESLKKMSPELSEMVNSPASNDTGRGGTINDSALQESVLIRQAVYDKTDRSIYSAGKVSLIGKASQLHVVACILSKDDEILGQKGFFRRDCGYLEVDCDAIDLSEYPKGAKIVIHASYIPMQTNQLCSMVVIGQAAICEEDVIESISVKDPVKRKEHEDAEIRVSYARTPLKKELIDYIYPERRDDKRNQHFFLEMVGALSLKANYHIEKIMETRSGSSAMSMTFLEQGDIFYENDFMKCITIDSDKKGFSWNFFKAEEPKDPAVQPVPTIEEDPANWNAPIPMSRLAGNKICYFDMHIAFTVKERPGELFEALVTSDPTPAYKGSNGYFRIPKLHLYWGCLAEGTMILMADGREKPIEKIQLNDTVRNREGRTAVVENIYMGPEEEVLCLKSDAGVEICCTSTHPFLTEEGPKRAMDLRETDKLQMADGSFSTLKYCFPKKFEGKVYNLEFREANFIYANGYTVGDFRMQNELYKPQRNFQQPMDDYALEKYFEGIR